MPCSPHCSAWAQSVSASKETPTPQPSPSPQATPAIFHNTESIFLSMAPISSSSSSSSSSPPEQEESRP